MTGPAPVTDADRARLRAFVSARHPGEPLRFFEEGWDSTVVLAGETAYRFPRGAWATERVRAEIAFLERFAPRSPLAVPTPVLHDEPLHSVYAFIPGAPLDPARFTEWTPEARARAAEDLAAFLSALHAFPPGEALALGFRADAWATEWWVREVEEMRAHALPLLDADGRALAERVIEASHPANLRAPAACVVHNDLFAEHIIADGERFGGVIDFGDAAIGDPALDFQWCTELGRDFLDDVCARYAHPIDEGMRERLGAYRAYHLLRHVLDERKWGAPDAARAEASAFVDNVSAVVQLTRG